ncbi:MAG: hypothetical protein R2874_16315 [Desulfobacterales bacterium]
MTLDVSVLRERRSQALADRVTVAPPQSEKEITSRMDAMMRIAGEETILRISGSFPLRTPCLRWCDQNVGAQTLYAEVISRPTICEVCEDVHFSTFSMKKARWWNLCRCSSPNGKQRMDSGRY